MGYGAGVVNPYLAFETIDDMIAHGLITGVSREDAIDHYVKALNKGILKVMSKMGISTLASYCGAQIFEAIGLPTKKSIALRAHQDKKKRKGRHRQKKREGRCLRHDRAFGGSGGPSTSSTGRRIPVAPGGE